MGKTLSRTATVETATQVFSALSEPIRLRLLSLLIHNGETCVCDLVSATGLNQTTVSRHLATLRHAGLVNGRKEGLWVYYSIIKSDNRIHSRLLSIIRDSKEDIPELKTDLSNLKTSLC